MPTKSEIQEIPVKSLMPEAKQAITWGEYYQIVKPVQIYLGRLLKKFYIDPQAVVEYFARLNEYAVYQGMSTFERETRGWAERYLTLSRVSGVKINELGIVQPLGEKDEHKFNSIIHTILGTLSEEVYKKHVYEVIQIIAKETRIYRVVMNTGEQMYLPEHVLALYKQTIKLLQDEYTLQQELEEANWLTRKEKIKKLMDEMTIMTYKTLTEEEPVILMNNITELEAKIEEIKMREERLKRMKKARPITRRDVKRRKIKRVITNVRKKKEK